MNAVGKSDTTLPLRGKTKESVFKKPSGQKEKERESKRARIDSSLIFSALPFQNFDTSRASDNIVRMSSDFYDKIFSAETPEGAYIKIANFAYRAFRSAHLQNTQIEISTGLYNDIENSFNRRLSGNEVYISPFESYDVGNISTLRLKVFPYGELNCLSSRRDAKTIFVNSLSEIIESHTNETILSLGQKLYINHPVVGPLYVVIDKWGFEGYSNNFLQQELPAYGRITPSTNIRWSSGNPSQIKLLEEMNSEIIEKFEFTIEKIRDVSAKELTTGQRTSLNEAWTRGSLPLPLCIPFPKMREWILDEFLGRKLTLGSKTKIRVSHHWKLTTKLTKVFIKDSETEDKSKYEKCFSIGKDHAISVTDNTNVIFTTNYENSRMANEVTFEIIDKKIERNPEEKELFWVSVAEIIAQIKEEMRLIPIGGKIDLKIGDGKYLLKLKKANGAPLPHPREAENIKSLFAISESTDINIYQNSSTGLILVDTKSAYPLEKLRIKVSFEGEGSKNPIAALFGIDTGDAKKTILNEEDLIKIFKHSSSRHLIEDQVVKGITDKGETVVFKILKVTPKDTTLPPYKHGHLFCTNSETKIEFEAEKGGEIVISSIPKQIHHSDINARLLELGVGGLSNQFKKLVSSIVLSRSTYKEHVQSLGLNPPRGILLYGPPGTGKTQLAKCLGDLLGVTDDRIQLFTGSEVWTKYLGDSEKKVREMFIPAKEDQNKFGDKSPLHLLIIDEIDAFLGDRKDADKSWERSVVNTFIAEMDGISSKSSEPLNNLIVVGLTNHPKKIDPAVLREGRLGTKIHIKIPDAKGRAEIFAIHLRAVLQTKILADEVSIEELVRLTPGKTGAFIQGLCKKATDYSLLRLYESDVSKEEVSTHPLSKVTLADFKQALSEMSNEGEEEEEIGTAVNLSLVLKKKDIREKLKAFGLAGLPNELIQLVFDIKNSENYRDYLFKIGQAHPKGVFLYGPANVGKTTFAKKALPKILGLTGERFQYFSASELWPLQGKNLKEKMELILTSAKNAAKDLKHEAPLHVVVIDNLDALYSHRREKDVSGSSVINQVVKELEELMEVSEAHNLILIGITDRIFKISESVIAHGKYGKHIAIELPGYDARKEIFEVYLDKFKKGDLLEDDINLNDLATMTEDRSGAFIEGMVNYASHIATRRLAKNQIPSEKAFSSPLAKIQMEDLNLAYQAISEDATWKQMFL